MPAEQPKDLFDNRVDEWDDFAELVSDHIQNYTCNQYGRDLPDQMSSFDVRDCLNNALRYVNRNLATNSRGPKEAMRDMLKLAHYACTAYQKMFQENMQQGPTGQLFTADEYANLAEQIEDELRNGR